MRHRALFFVACLSGAACGPVVELDAEIRTGLYVVDDAEAIAGVGCGVLQAGTAPTARFGVIAEGSTLIVFGPGVPSETSRRDELRQESEGVWLAQTAAEPFEACASDGGRYSQFSDAAGDVTAMQVGDESFDLLRDWGFEYSVCVDGEVEPGGDCAVEVELRYSLDEECAAPCRLVGLETLDPGCDCF